MRTRTGINKTILAVLALFGVLVLSACGSAVQNVETCNPYRVSTGTGTKVLIVGDSISEGYTCAVQDLLNNRGYAVSRIPTNAHNTTYTLANIDRWLAEAQPEIVVWNNGLWDATQPDYRVQGDLTVYSNDITTYQANLAAIAQKIMNTGARVIFMTTTDINVATASAFRPGFETEMNNVAKTMLPYYGVEVYDLNAVAKTIPQLHMSPDNVHFVDSGYKIFGSFVVNAITQGVQ